VVVYHMTVFSLSKWSIKKIDKSGRIFFGADQRTLDGDTASSIDKECKGHEN
jgi:hypothetical protein